MECKGCHTEDERAFDDEKAQLCVGCDEFEREMADELAYEEEFGV